jgi:hypothetical protein
MTWPEVVFYSITSVSASFAAWAMFKYSGD